jgi:hypothetical protein
MRNIFLAPRSNETAYKNYMSSMQGKRIEELAPYLSHEDLGQLEGDDRYFVWGCQPSQESKWRKMRHGDYVLFYARGRFISYGQLKFKKKSEILALSLWPKSKDSDEPWSCVFFVESIHEINLPIKEFASLTGYNIDRVQGFMPVVTALPKIIKRYGSTENFMNSLQSNLGTGEIAELITIIDQPSKSVSAEDKTRIDDLTRGKTEEELENSLAEYAKGALGKAPEQVERIVKSFKRNRKLVTDIKAKYQNKCQICGFTFKMATGAYYSEAAHIIPISSREAGVDSPDNIWVLCANHHKMLDMGAIRSISKSEYEEAGKIKVLLKS